MKKGLLLAGVACGAIGAASAAAAPFAQAWAKVPRTPAARAAKDVLVFDMEQDVTGFNVTEASQASYWTALAGNTAVLLVNYIFFYKVNNHHNHTTKNKTTKKSLTITIMPNATWY